MKKTSKNIIFIVCAMLMLGSSFSTFATNVDNNNTKKERPAKEDNKNVVIGKITSIDATNVTVSIATRKKREKKNVDKTQNTQKEKQIPSIEDRFTLTGESKTYNISSADFGRKRGQTATTENTEEKAKNEKMTYADYKVGDYVKITLENETSTTVKRIRNANQGFDFANKGKKENRAKKNKN